MPIKILEEKLGKKIAAAMAAAFLDDTKDIIDEIEACVTTREPKRLRELCHKLAGISASIGDKDTQLLCRTLEDQGDEQAWDKADASYTSLAGSLKHTREDLNEYLKTS